MTALGGMALLMEGSTIRDGKYADNIRRACDWLMDRSQRNGLISQPWTTRAAATCTTTVTPCSSWRASTARRKTATGDGKLEGILTRAVDFTGKAQTKRGGWGYISAAEGGGFDEGSITITQVQAIRAARNAGIVVPKSIIDNAKKYLKDATTARGSSLQPGAGGGNEGGPALVAAAAIASGFSAGEYDSALVRNGSTIAAPPSPSARAGASVTTNTPTTITPRPCTCWGTDGYAKLFPESKAGDRLTWSKYRSVDLQAPGQYPECRRQLVQRPHRHGLHDHGQPDHPAAGQRHPADLPALSGERRGVSPPCCQTAG